MDTIIPLSNFVRICLEKMIEKTNQANKITQWVEDALTLPGVQLQVRLRGNHLHILCEGEKCPPQESAIRQLSAALSEKNLDSLLPPEHPRVYQVFVSGRILGLKRNSWTVRLDPNTPSNHTAFPVDASFTEMTENCGDTSLPSPYRLENEYIVSDIPTPKSPSSLLVSETVTQKDNHQNFPHRDSGSITTEAVNLTVSYQRRAQKGEPDAIASYLSDILGVLGVAVKVRSGHKPATTPFDRAKNVGNGEATTGEKRLWVLCESAYSPDPSLLAEPIAQRLRDLQLDDFRDAIIISQVRGERKPDWLLRVDLTSPERMLKEWGRWGDKDAIQYLLQRVLPDDVEVRATLNDTTLHLFCHQRGAFLPNKDATINAIGPLLLSLAPQGILAATVYGIGTPKNGQESPHWIDWIQLPASQHPDLQPKTKTLAAQGDRDALSFLLNRLVNPDLDYKLKTGGIRLKFLYKDDLLHIMSEALTCPSQVKVGPILGKFLQELKLPNIAGIRIYGRRGGQKVPLWRYGMDFIPRKRQKAEEKSPDFDPSVTDMTFSEATLNLIWHPNIDISHVSQPAIDLTDAPQTRSFLIPQTRSFLIPQEREITIPQEREITIPQEREITIPQEREITIPQEREITILQGREITIPQGRETTIPQEPETTQKDELRVKVKKKKFRYKPRKFVYPRSKENVSESLAKTLQKTLLASGLFTPQTPNPDSENGSIYQRVGIALVGVTVGCVLTWLLDAQGSRVILSTSLSKQEIASLPSRVTGESQDKNSTVDLQPIAGDMMEGSLSQIQLKHDTQKDSDVVFNDAQFTKSADKTRLGNCQGANTWFKGENCPSVSSVSYPSFRSQQLDEQLARYQRYLQRIKRPPHILIVGSSRALRGIDPTALEQALAPKGYPGLKIYNFGINGATAQTVDVLIRRILPPEQLPELILWADGVRALNSGRVDVTFNAIASSEGYQKLGQTSFQVRSKPFDNSQKKKEALNPLTSVSLLIQQVKQTEPNLRKSLEKKLENVSVTHQERDRVKGLLLSFLNSSKSLIAPAQGQLIPTSNPEKTEDIAENSAFQRNGYLPLNIRFNLESYYQEHPRVPGDYDSDYQSFQLSGVQYLSLIKMVNYAKENKIKVVFINMPLTDDYLDTPRLNYEKKFRQSMLELEKQTGLMFRDLAQLWPDKLEYFSDPSHLNRYGGSAIAESLAQDSSIPWPKSR